jgi:hypothetical protein
VLRAQEVVHDGGDRRGERRGADVHRRGVGAIDLRTTSVRPGGGQEKGTNLVE